MEGAWDELALARADRKALVHIVASYPSELPRQYRQYQLLEIEAPSGASIGDAALADENWQRDIALTRRVGDHGLANSSSLMLRVSSAVVGRTLNLLLNPAHLKAGDCRVLSVARYSFDDRPLVAAPLQEH